MVRERAGGAGSDEVTRRPRRREPERTCIGCRTRTTKSELLRVTARPDADGRMVVTPDPRGAAPGRGAHVHPARDCVDIAIRRKAFARALRTGVVVEAPALWALVDSLDRHTPAT